MYMCWQKAAFKLSMLLLHASCIVGWVPAAGSRSKIPTLVTAPDAGLDSKMLTERFGTASLFFFMLANWNSAELITTTDVAPTTTRPARVNVPAAKAIGEGRLICTWAGDFRARWLDRTAGPGAHAETGPREQKRISHIIIVLSETPKEVGNERDAVGGRRGRDARQFDNGFLRPHRRLCCEKKQLILHRTVMTARRTEHVLAHSLHRRWRSRLGAPSEVDDPARATGTRRGDHTDSRSERRAVCGAHDPLQLYIRHVPT